MHLFCTSVVYLFVFLVFHPVLDYRTEELSAMVMFKYNSLLFLSRGLDWCAMQRSRRAFLQRRALEKATSGRNLLYKVSLSLVVAFWGLVFLLNLWIGHGDGYRGNSLISHLILVRLTSQNFFLDYPITDLEDLTKLPTLVCFWNNCHSFTRNESAYLII